MKKLISSRILRKIAVTYLMATVLLINSPFQAYADLVTVTVQANGQNALTLATSTDSFDITLTTSNAVSCTMTSPSIGGGIAINASMHISPGDTTYYPSIGGSVTFAVTCDDGHVVTGSGSVVVSLPAASTPAPTVNITANGVHGSTTITSPDSYTY